MAEKSMADPAKENLQIEIKPPPLSQPRLSTDFTADDLLKDQRVPFFGPLQQRRENTWVISLFVIFYLLAFAATMLLNDCWKNSHADCAFKPLGRLSFQPLLENPLLGPSSSSLDEIGALRLTTFSYNHETWRLFTSPWLHAGLFHLLINLSCIIFVGIHLEQEFGPLRIGIIFILSAFSGSLVAALFLNDRPSVDSSGALFGLLGAMLSGLIRNWIFYTKKFAALMVFCFILAINLLLGLLPYINNFANIGGFVSGLLLGFVLLFNPQLGKMTQNKVGLFDYEVKCSIKLRQKLDRPVMRIVSLVLFSLSLAGVIVGVLHGVNVNKSCSWCQYVDCVPFKWWSCSDKATRCEALEISGHLTLTCEGNDKFRSFPFTNLSKSRIEDLCYILCS